jgi:hypothetical protein
MVLLWVVSVFALLVLTQCYQWVKAWELPLPGLLILGGALAIASNLRSLGLPRMTGRPEKED